MNESRYKDLREVRYKNGDLSQTEMAERIGISVANYGKIETGKVSGSVRTWERIQDLFGLTDGDVWRMMKSRKKTN